MINLQVGTTYKTRNGCTVKITDDVDDPYPFFGRVVRADGTHDRLAYFSAGGQYSRSHSTEYDIVEVLSE